LNDGPVGGRLAAILSSGSFCVTGEIVPPRSGDATTIAQSAAGLVGYVDAVNITDNSTATVHMSPLAGVGFASEAGLEPTLQLTSRDRNRLAIASDLLGAWALGARNVLCLSGDPIGIGDHPDAATVNDLSVLDMIRLARVLRDDGKTLGGSEISNPPRYLIGVAEMPLADPYDPSRLEAKLDAGADVVWTQIAYDVDRIAAWADGVAARGVFERAKVIVGVAPLRSPEGARFMHEKLPGVSVPDDVMQALQRAGGDAASVGRELTISIVRGLGQVEGVSGVHLMGMGHDEEVRAVVEGAGLFPRPTGVR
jgi:methylenetetrahydrofolate reductase (NADPH)